MRMGVVQLAKFMKELEKPVTFRILQKLLQLLVVALNKAGSTG